MLNKDEELRVASFIGSLRDDVKKEREETDLTPRALLWLAEKLKEVNDDLKFMNEENTKLSKKLFRYTRGHEEESIEMYENPKMHCKRENCSVCEAE